MVKVSVIIPVYNVENYLKECLDSVVNQTLTDIEIICINDGSTDCSLSILESYANSDNRFKIISKENEGQGSARNVGLNCSSGEYIYFMDADDYIDLNMFTELYKNAISNNSDIVVSKIARFNDGSDEINYNNPGFNFEKIFKKVDFENFTFNYKDIKKYVLNASFAPWMKLFKRSFLIDNNLNFPEGIAFEDVVFHVKTFLEAKRISFSPNYFYYYRNNPNSTMNTAENGFDIFKIIYMVEDYLKVNKLSNEFKEEFEFFKVTQITNYLISTNSEDYFKKSKEEFSKLDISNNNLISVSLFKKYNLVLNSASLSEYIDSLNAVAISVIIPVYNVEDYLEECLDSVVNQTFDNIEIICINDGSTDNSLNILREYSKKDDRVKIINQKNLGVSYARNVGLEVSIGNYICFLDSDDYLELNALEEVYNISESNSLDICLFKLINFDDATHKQYTEEYFDMSYLNRFNGNVFNHDDVGSELFRISVTPHSKLFNKNLVSQIKFPEGLIYEDNVFFTEAMFKAERVLFYDKYLYNRRIRKNSITNSFNRRCIDWIKIYNLLITLTENYGFYDEYKSVLYHKAIYSSYNIFKDLNERFKQEFFIQLKEDYIVKSSEWLNDESFINLNERLKFIFNECISSKNYIEFEFKIELYDLNLFDEIDLSKVPSIDDDFNLNSKKSFSNYINNCKELYHILVNTSAVKFALTPLIPLTYKLCSSNLLIQDKIDILRFARPLYLRLLRIENIHEDNLKKFIGCLRDNEYLAALNLIDNNFEYSFNKNNEIFLLFWGLHEEIGGLTKAVCDRANLFNKNGYSVKLLNIDSIKNSEFIINKYRELGFINHSIEIINIFDYYSKKNSFEFLYSENFSNERNNNYFVKKIENSDNSITLKYFDCLGKNDCSLKNLIKEELYISGYLALKKLFKKGEVIKEYYYTCDNFNYFYIDYIKNDFMLFDRFCDGYISFENIEEFHDYFVSELCLKANTKPFLINDCSSRYPSIKNIERDVAYKIGVVHNNPYFEPYCYGSRRWNIASLNDIEHEDVVVVLTESAKKDFIKEFNLDKFRVIPNFLTDENIKKSYNEYNKENNVISIFARISSDKNISDLIRAFNKLLEKHSGAVLKIYGRALIPDEIIEKDKLEKLINKLGISDSVEFMGHTDNVYEEMSKSLITVLCSTIEGFGLVIIESMVNKTPVVSYDTNYGPNDIILNDVNGFIVNQFDIDALYEKLLYAFENPKKIHDMGELARQHILNYYTEKVVYDKWRNLFNDLILDDK